MLGHSGISQDCEFKTFVKHLGNIRTFWEIQRDVPGFKWTFGTWDWVGIS